MKRLIILLLATGSFCLTSCEKVIDIDLNEADPKYVIQANLFEGTHPFVVDIRRSTDFFGKAPQEKVTDAVVMLYAASGDSTAVPYLGDGRYELPAFTAQPGTSYMLKVKAGGNSFTAATTMPFSIAIDSLVSEFEEADFRDEGYEITAWFQDPPVIKNFYRMLITVNDTLQNEAEDLYLLDDKFNDGRKISADFGERYKAGDKIEVELRSMDEPVFNYYTTLNDLLNNQNGPAPSNPVTNFTGGALGYFGAFTRSTASMTIN